jgi:multidrug efflux system membrane fusion protein
MNLRRPLRAAPNSLPLVLVLALTAAGCGSNSTSAAPKKAPSPPVPVVVGEVVQKAMPVQVRAIGNVQAFSTVAVKPQVSGSILKVHIAAGQQVRPGDLLFTIDPRPFETALQGAEANLARNTAQREQARAALAQKQAETRQAEANLVRTGAQLQMASAQERRYQELVQKELVARDQYEQIHTHAIALDATRTADEAALDNARAAGAAARATIENAEAAIRADRAAVEFARLQLSYCSIRSPINGRAGDVLVHAGNVVKANPDNPLLVINQIQPIYVTFAVPEPYLPQVARLRAAGDLRVETLVREPSRSIPGRLSFMNNAVDTATGTILLKATFPNADGALWPGQFVDIALTLATEPDAVVVPAPAIQTGQQGSYVFVVRPDQTVESRPVTVARTVAREAVVASGLKPGERVVTDGQLRLAPGAKVEIKSGGEAPKRTGDADKDRSG